MLAGLAQAKAASTGAASVGPPEELSGAGSEESTDPSSGSEESPVDASSEESGGPESAIRRPPSRPTEDDELEQAAAPGRQTKASGKARRATREMIMKSSTPS
jgi:hypothetical protein